jgi:hypothetical protein
LDTFPFRDKKSQDIDVSLTQKLLKRRREQKRLTQFGNSYLRPKGWQESFEAGFAVDGRQNATPWITYPATAMLRKVVSKEHEVFEYGCGASSLWWAAHAASVISVEHDSAWANIVSARAPANLLIEARTIDEIDTVNSMLTKQFFSSVAPALDTSEEKI